MVALHLGKSQDGEYITSEIKKITQKPISMKLTPNVTDITEIAKAVEAGGADSISLINTITGMRIDVQKRKFCVANKTGGLSGSAIKPIALRMVYQVCHAVKIPVIGMGGIATINDVLEFDHGWSYWYRNRNSKF